MQSMSAATRAGIYINALMNTITRQFRGLKTIGDLSSNFFVLKKCRKIRLPDLRNAFY